MNCNVPTDICFSFTGFQARGGLTDEHQDGWGIAFFEGKGVRQFLDSTASVHSPIAELVRNYPIKSKTVISHIRKATQGSVHLENTHPFMREMWGQYWIFAHNGNILEFSPKLNGTFLPVGSTDSELSFCYILQELKREFPEGHPGDQKFFEALTRLTIEVGAKGEFNFLLSNGDTLFTHCSSLLAYVIRKAPFTTASLKDQEMTIDFSQVTHEKDQVAIIATIPLTDNEQWTVMEPGSLWMFKEGSIVSSSKTIAGQSSHD